MNMELDRLRRRAVELGNVGKLSDHRELLDLLASGYPAVRRAAASALGKLIDRSSSLSGVIAVPLFCAAGREESPQVLEYMLKTLAKCAKDLNVIMREDVLDMARDPTRQKYVREAASLVIAAAEVTRQEREGLLRHWCSRCQKPISAEESQAGLAKYGKPYCRHCLEERQLEDVNFTATVEGAKRLRTVDEVAVQSQGERRIGDWLSQRGIAYRYDERYLIARDVRIRPDFYLPEFDLSIEYWGMDTPEYVANMEKKKFLYQRAGKKLISINWRELSRLEAVLEEKLSRYIRV